MTKPLIPISLALFSEIIALNPVQRMMGISGRISSSFWASFSPVICGMVMSVMIRSNLSGRALKAFSASILLVLTTTARLAVDADRPVHVAHNTVDHGQSQSGSHALFLGCEIRVKDPLQHLRAA